MPRNSGDRITPELPRAPRGADATQEAAASIASKLFSPQLGGGAVHGKAHVGAGIAVGDGENVKIVDYLNIVAERGVRAEHHFLERRSVNIFSQVNTSGAAGLPDNCIYINIHALYGHAGGLGELVAHFVHDAGETALKLTPRSTPYVKFQRNAALIVKSAPRCPFDMDSRRRSATGRLPCCTPPFPFDAKAVLCRGVSGKIRKDLAGDADGSDVVSYIHHKIRVPFRLLFIGRKSWPMYDYNINFPQTQEQFFRAASEMRISFGHSCKYVRQIGETCIFEINFSSDLVYIFCFFIVFLNMFLWVKKGNGKYF